MHNQTLTQFNENLASKQAVPGGGGASALVGALAASLGCMVANLTIGKKKYKETEGLMQDCLVKLTDYQQQLLACINNDAIAFKPLSQAYSLPKDTENLQEIKQSCLVLAANSPLNIMRLTCNVIEVLETVSKIGSKLALSDAATAAAFSQAGLKGAAINVYCNTTLMSDKNVASAMNSEVEEMLEKYCPLAQEIYDSILEGMK